MAKKISTNLFNCPLIVILGSTGTGKSKLGIELAKKLNGEIISADSMQVYEGLDIITNKVTNEEQREVKHHLINVIKPSREYTVHEFRASALDIIAELNKKNKVPIIVGGTNYYIESILWNFLMTEKESVFSKTSDKLQQRKTKCSEDLMKNCDESCSLYEKLQKIDPVRAEELHPNDLRKISRSLQIYRETGKKHSDLLKEQKRAEGSSRLGGPLRFSKSLIFWLKCEQNVLNKRITDRVDSMISKGLLEEVLKFHKDYTQFSHTEFNLSTTTEKQSCSEETCVNEVLNDDKTMSKRPRLDSNIANSKEKFSNNKINKTVSWKNNGVKTTNTFFQDGQLQAIGFKEFHAFITYTGNDKKEKEKLLKNSIERLKNVTIRYSKKQKTWVQNRFLSRDKNSSPDIYELNVTDLEKWDENVLGKALKIAECFLEGKEIPYEPHERDLQSLLTDKHKRFVCQNCDNKVIIGENNWAQHVSSRMHKRRKSKRV